MVRGLVKQEGLRISKQGLRQQHADFLPALQLAHGPFVQFIWNVQALQKDGRVALRRVSVFLADNSFQFPKPHAVRITNLGLGINFVALLGGCPQPLIAHDDGVNRAIPVKGKLVLAQHADLSRVNDRPLLRVDLAGQELHESGFSGAVRPGKSIAFPRRKAGRNFIE